MANLSNINNKFLVTTGGNVGINTTSPGEKLEVAGNVGVNGFITHNGDSGTFMGWSADDTNVFYTAGNERLRIDASGNVGIGTDSPNFTLDVEADKDTWISRIYNTGSDANAQSLLIRSDATSAHDALVMGVYADSGYKMVVRSTGNVGIGTTSPTLSLDVRGTQGTPASSGTAQTGSLSIRGVGSHFISSGVLNASPWSGWFQAQDANNLATTYPLSLNPNGGNVGIGTTSPAQPVHLLNGGFAYMRFTSQGYGATGFDIGQHTNGNIYLNNRDNTAMVFMTNNTERMNILAGGTGTFYNAFSIQGDDKSLIVRNAAGTVIGTMGAESSSTPNVGMTTIRNNGTTTIQFNSNGSSYINGGNVGIGTTSPGEKLEVNGVIQIKRIGDHPAIRFVENTTTRGYIGTGDWAVNGGADADLGISSAGTGSLILGTNSGNGRVYIVNGGNVGIGDTSPQGKLEVNNRNTATGAALFIKGGEDDLSPIAGQYTGLAFGYGGGDIYNNGAILWEFTNTAANGKLHFAVNPTAGDGTADLSDSKMTILDSGNVGIGTTSPSSKLHVVGGATNSQHIVRGPYTVGLSGNSLGNATFTAAFNFNGFYNTGYTIEVYALFNHWNSSTANYTYCYRKALLFGYNAAGAAQIDGPGGGVSNSVNVGAWTFSVDNNGVTGYAQRILATKSAGNAAWHGTYWIQIVSSVPLDPLDVS
jgi:hypothetical protein